ncbi:hypothetical protein RRG08_023327 [Elysia crispata]|uniref:Uncharacterized protein n=1 Tax=Elysia crispata TaxID=231223 RepID=A0AAE1EDH5_9GAST|nr:hypothetical protein RRG08_023327 [Elysia crispata]
MLHAPAADAASGGLGWAAGVAEVAVRAVEGRDMEVGADSVDDGLFWLTTHKDARRHIALSTLLMLVNVALELLTNLVGQLKCEEKCGSI